MSCPDEPVATIALRYADRRIVIGELRPNGIPAYWICARDTWPR